MFEFEHRSYRLQKFMYIINYLGSILLQLSRKPHMQLNYFIIWGYIKVISSYSFKIKYCNDTGGPYLQWSALSRHSCETDNVTKVYSD